MSLVLNSPHESNHESFQYRSVRCGNSVEGSRAGALQECSGWKAVAFGLETDRLRKFWEGKAPSAPVAGLRVSWNRLGRNRALPWLFADFGRGRLRPPPSLAYACHGIGLDGAAPSRGCSPILGGEGSARPHRWFTLVMESAWTEPRPPV